MRRRRRLRILLCRDSATANLHHGQETQEKEEGRDEGRDETRSWGRGREEKLQGKEAIRRRDFKSAVEHPGYLREHPQHGKGALIK